MDAESVKRKVLQLERVEGRTEAEAETYLAEAARLRKKHPEAFVAPAAPAPAVKKRPGRRPAGGTLSAPFVLGDTYVTTYRWVLLLGLSSEAGCVLAEEPGGDVHVFGARDAVAMVLMRQAEVLPEIEAEAALAEAQILPETPTDRRVYFGASYRRAYVAGRMGERRSLVAITRRKERAKQAALLADKVKRAGWHVVIAPPQDLWAPKTSG